MADDQNCRDSGTRDASVDESTVEAIRTVVTLDTHQVEQVRRMVAPRTHPAGQVGPSADLGDPD